MAHVHTGRTIRLECIKIAASIVCQLKDPKVSVVGLAKEFMTFVDAPSKDESTDAAEHH